MHTHHLHKLHNSVEQKTILGENPLKEVQNTFEKMWFLVQTKSSYVVKEWIPAIVFIHSKVNLLL